DSHYDDLRTLVTDKLEGCDRWDDTCITLLRALNSKIPSSDKQSMDILAPGFSGQIILPSRNYRLVLEYSDPTDASNLLKLLEAIKKERARELRIDPVHLAIQFSSPTGDPRPQTSTIRSDAPNGYDVLRAMNYPFTDSSSEAERNSYFLVDAAMWDT